MINHHIQRLDEFAQLENNWDLDDAIAPTAETVNRAKDCVMTLENNNYVIYNVAPGPNGEILVELRSNHKSLELLFYLHECKYVKFPNNGKPTQGIFILDDLLNVVTWLTE